MWVQAYMEVKGQPGRSILKHFPHFACNWFGPLPCRPGCEFPCICCFHVAASLGCQACMAVMLRYKGESSHFNTSFIDKPCPQPSLWFFETRACYNLNWPRTFCVDQAGLELVLFFLRVLWNPWDCAVPPSPDNSVFYSGSLFFSFHSVTGALLFLFCLYIWVFKIVWCQSSNPNSHIS